MKQSLHYYYIRNKKRITAFMIINIWYFLSVSISYCLVTLFNINSSEMFGFGDSKSDNDLARIGYFFLKIIVVTPILLYTYLSTKNVNIKDWMIDILLGYKIIDYYDQSSIFIKFSWFCKSKTSRCKLFLNIYYIEIKLCCWCVSIFKLSCLFVYLHYSKA